MTVAAGTGALEATQQLVLSQLQSGINVTSNSVADTIATGTLTAAQPTAGTVVAGGTVSITLGTGQGTWEAQLTGTFSSGTTIVFEGTDDTGVTTNWFTTVGYNTTVTNPPNITSVGGPGPFVIRGSASGYQQIRMRASALTVSDSISVRLIGSNAPLGLGGLSTNDGSFALESGGNLATIKNNTTGLATQTTLAAANSSLSTIATNTTGIATASNQTTANSSLSTIATNTTGIATASNQTTGNSSLSTIATNTGRLPAQGAAITSASTPVNIASDQIVPTKGNFTEQASLSAGSLNADLVASTDVSAYKWLSLHINSNAYSGTLTFQASNDNSNWVSMMLYRIDAPGYSVGSATASTTNVMYVGAIQFRYLRVRMTSYSSGTAQGTLELYTVTPGMPSVTSVQAYQGSTWTIQPGNTPNTTAWLTNSIATSGGTTDYHRISTADTNAANVKASAGQIYGYDIGNNGASDAYVKLYNKASSPTVGTDTVFRTIYVPKGSRAHASLPNGIAMGTGISVGITGGAADSDTTAVAASQVTLELDYK